jgi:hypothetical protein
MIRNEREYKEASRLLRQEKKRLADYQGQLKSIGLAREQVKRALEPMRALHQQLADEIQAYGRLRRGQYGDLTNLEGLGQCLVALRVAGGMTQLELAKRVGVHASQVSRDERNEYRGITLERASRTLQALGAEMRTQVKLAAVKKARSA